MDTAIIIALSVLTWTTSAIAGALIGGPIKRVRLCAALGLLLGPIGIIVALFMREPMWGSDPYAEATGPSAGPSTRTDNSPARADMRPSMHDGMR